MKYLWLFARENAMPEAVKQEYLNKARELGYYTDDLGGYSMNKTTSTHHQ